MCRCRCKLCRLGLDAWRAAAVDTYQGRQPPRIPTHPHARAHDRCVCFFLPALSFPAPGEGPDSARMPLEDPRLSTHPPQGVRRVCVRAVGRGTAHWLRGGQRIGAHGHGRE